MEGNQLFIWKSNRNVKGAAERETVTILSLKMVFSSRISRCVQSIRTSLNKEEILATKLTSVPPPEGQNRDIGSKVKTFGLDPTSSGVFVGFQVRSGVRGQGSGVKTEAHGLIKPASSSISPVWIINTIPGSFLDS